VGEVIKVNAEGTIKEGVKWINMALKSWRRALANALMKLFNSVWGSLDDLKLSLSTVLRPQQEFSWMDSLHISPGL
jgi:hypothetical protein